MREVLILLALINVVSTVQLAGSALATVDARIGIGKVKFFSGPRIVNVAVRGIRLEIGCIPIGSGLEFADGALETQAASLPAFRRIALRLNGYVATFVLAVLALGVGRGMHSTLAGFEQSILGAVAPVSRGQALARGMFAVISGTHLTYSLGIVATKLTAFGLVPAAMQLVVELICGPDLRKHGAIAWIAVIYLLWTALAVGWLVAIVLSLLG